MAKTGRCMKKIPQTQMLPKKNNPPKHKYPCEKTLGKSSTFDILILKASKKNSFHSSNMKGLNAIHFAQLKVGKNSSYLIHL